LFCGGRTCSKENFRKNPHENAIFGLHSDWITPDVLAMQRPSSRIIREYNIIDSFKKA
jgi:protein tyrosine phosphatase domain-containing protein 1